MKGTVAYLHFSTSKSDDFFLISMPSMRLVCFLSASVVFAISFMLRSYLVLENSINGKCASITSMQDAPSHSLDSLILYSPKHDTIYLFMTVECYMFYFEGVGEIERCSGYCGRWLLWPI